MITPKQCVGCLAYKQTDEYKELSFEEQVEQTNKEALYITFGVSLCAVCTMCVVLHDRNSVRGKVVCDLVLGKDE